MIWNVKKGMCKMKWFNTASLRWHYPNQVSGFISAKNYFLTPRAFCECEFNTKQAMLYSFNFFATG